jgi:hypothetical protein
MPAPTSPGDEVVTTTDGTLHLDLSNGATVVLEPASSFHLPDARAAGPMVALHEQARLDIGSVQIHVPHLADGHTFAVKTPDAEVTVHGTSFTVEVGEFASPDGHPLPRGSLAGAALATRVSVSEGTVSVSCGGHEVFVHAGMRWISPQAQRAEPAPAAPPDNATRARPASKDTARPAPPSSSELAEQNRLFSSAMAEARAGRDRAAVDLLNELLQRFPSSVYAQEARVQRFRALKSTDRAAAAREAQKYLALYPNGFARDEAKKMGSER